MADIVEKLFIMANLELGESLPPEIGLNIGWNVVISDLCAEALKEITTLRTYARSGIYPDWIGPKLYPEPQPEQPAEPWASSFVMDTSNWK